MQTYADLIAALGNWLQRSDITALFPNFIQLFEACANRRLRVRQQEATAILIPSTVAAPAIASQYNANVNNQIAANNALFNAGNTTASGLTNLAQTQLGNQLQGATLAGQIPGLAMAPAQAQLTAATTAQNLPLQNLAPYESLLTPLAQLGSQTTGTTQGTTTQSVPLSQQLIGGAIGGLGLFGGLGFPKLFGGSGSGGSQTG